MIPTDVGSDINIQMSLAPVTIVAGGEGDNSAQNGTGVDRTGYLSAVAVVPVKAVLSADKTLTLTCKVQDSADNSTFTDYAVGDALLLSGGTSGSTETGLVQLDVDLRMAKRYIRITAIGDLSATGTDTATFAGVLVLGGADVKPV